MPEESSYRYTKEHPYIGKGSNREVKLGVEYTGYEADVAEFNDMYMNKVYSDKGVQKMGLGIDEIVDATINFSRKNYADYFPTKPYPSDVKMVGNTIKSKKMPEYIAKFLAKAIRMLLQAKGQDFLKEYYKYIDDIYNYRIPLRDIASKGKIKKSIQEYLKDVQEVTKAGNTKSRQAWYELAIKENIKVDNGDTIYYINTGKAKSHADIKKVTHYYDGNTDVSKDIEKEYNALKREAKKNPDGDAFIKLEMKEGCKGGLSLKNYIAKYYKGLRKEDEIIFNCVMLPKEVIEKDNDVFCNDGLEYNTAKYIDAFNKRIKPLLVCFSKSIRDRILITNPEDKQYFTEEECKLSSGEPNKMSDQDTYEQLMTMEDKEFKFWVSNDLVPPFIEECGMGTWEELKQDYLDRMEKEKQQGIDKIRESYETALSEITPEEYDAFISDGEIPESILLLVDVDTKSTKLISKKYNDIIIGDISDIVESQAISSYMKTVQD